METTSSAPPPAAARVWRRGRDYADFAVGAAFDHHWGRTVTEADAVLFATQTLQHNPRYLNAERRPAGLVASPYLVLAIVVGMSVEDLSERSEAFLGMESVEFGVDVHPGDTLTAASTVTAIRPSASRPGFGIVTWRTEGRNQRSEPVVTLIRSNLFRTGDAAD
jgi:acyl dehydratase